MNWTKMGFYAILTVFLFTACAKPIAQFQVEDKKWEAPANIAFKNASQNAEAYDWNFGDGNTSTDLAPAHVYEKAGTYEVTLTAKKGKKINTATQSITVAEPPLEAGFVVEMGEKVAPVEVKFKNTSKGATRYEWNFGDYSTSKEENPTHSYRFSGNYTITLTAYQGTKKETVTEQIVIDAPENACLVQVETAFGNMTVQLFNETPKHRDNFIKLVEEGYFNDLLFHRVIDGFMVQGGDPDSKNAKAGQALGTGGPGYTIPAEFNPELLHYKGALAAARQGDFVNPQKESSGSQFYIVQGSALNDAMLAQMERRKGMKYTPAQKEKYKQVGGTPMLDLDYTVFGQVISGLEVIDAIAKVKRDGRDRPLEDVKMKMTVIK